MNDSNRKITVSRKSSVEGTFGEKNIETESVIDVSDEGDAYFDLETMAGETRLSLMVSYLDQVLNLGTFFIRPASLSAKTANLNATVLSQK